MLPIILTALCVAVASADTSSSMGSYPPTAGAVREYEYANAYMGSKPAYEYVASASSPYSKSDTRYMSDSSSDSTSSGSDTRPSYYKTKYGSESAVNALRPSASYSTSSSSSSSSEQTSSSQQQQQQPQQTQTQSGFTGSEYLSNPSSQTSAEYSTTGGVAYTYGEREPANHHHHTYASSSPDVSADSQAQQYSRPAPSSSGTVYASYSAAGSPGVDYGHRPSAGYSHGAMSSPGASEYTSSMHSQPHYHLHPPHMSSSGSSSYPGYDETYSSPHSIQSQSNSPVSYKYVMSSSPSKYQTVLGAIKSLFGGGGSILSDASPSASHISPYSMSPSSYYSSPASSMMYSPGHHPPTGMLTSSSTPVASVGSSPGYYHSSSFQPYSKSYPPMRFVMGYGSSSSGPSAGNKIIVVRDSSAGLGSGYPSSFGGSSILGSASSYSPTKSKLYAPGPPSYLTSAPSSMPSYMSGPPSGGYPGYSSSGSFGNGHGGSTFLGYST